LEARKTPPDPHGIEPAMWFARLARAVAEQDWLVVSAAREKLAGYGFDVREAPSKRRRKAAGEGGGR